MDGVVLRTLTGFLLFALLAGTQSAWPWGVATLIWVAYTIVYGTTYVVEPVPRKSHPRLFWTVSLVWSTVALSMILYDFPLLKS